jgi:uncharacterized integral membrane protein
MKIIALLIATVIAVGISVFSARNPEVIHIDLLMGKVSVPLSLAVFVSAFLGAMAGGVLVVLLKGEGAKRAISEKNK